MAHISTANTKLGCIPSVNLPPVETCLCDAPCIAHCYARKGRFRFPSVRKTLEYNWQEWRNKPVDYMNSVIQACINVRYFRWHSSGDIPSRFYLHMMCVTAKICPEVRFLCFTKKYELVNSYLETYGSLPENLCMVFSAWGDFIPENPHNLPVAYVELSSGEGACHIPDDAIECCGSCFDCIRTDASCWHLNNGQSVKFKQH